MTLHGIEVQMEFPATQAPVRELLHALAHHLEKDAERYMRTNKCDRKHPAVADKIDAASAIRRTALALADRSKKRWEQSQRTV